MRRWLRVAATLAILGALTTNAAAQEPPPSNSICDLYPEREECVAEDSGDGDSDVDDAATNDYTKDWGPGTVLNDPCETDPPVPKVFQFLVWTQGPLAGQTVYTGDVGALIGIGDHIPFAPPDAFVGADGFSYRTVCVDMSITVDVAEEVERRRSDPGFDKDPAVQGLTGLDTWVWYQADPQVRPFGLEWIDPATGVTVQLEAWAWITDFTWTFGDGGTATTHAALYEHAPDAAGSHDTPAGTHVYETTSSQAGFPDGYPVSTQVTWIGEWRWRTGDAWSIPIPMATTITARFDTIYPVIQIRSVLE